MKNPVGDASLYNPEVRYHKQGSAHSKNIASDRWTRRKIGWDRWTLQKIGLDQIGGLSKKIGSDRCKKLF
jgi:hypothetical protein